MKRLLILLAFALLPAPFALAQTPGNSVGFWQKAGCQPPGTDFKLLCIGDDKSITVSVAGSAYGPPLNMTGTVTVSVDPITITGAPGTAASVVNAGSNTNAVFRFTVPAGKDGIDGKPGIAGNPGAAASIAIGTVAAMPAGSTPTVQNSGTQSAAIFNFGIPAGAPGVMPANFTCAGFTSDNTGIHFNGCK